MLVRPRKKISMNASLLAMIILNGGQSAGIIGPSNVLKRNEGKSIDILWSNPDRKPIKSYFVRINGEIKFSKKSTLETKYYDDNNRKIESIVYLPNGTAGITLHNLTMEDNNTSVCAFIRTGALDDGPYCTILLVYSRSTHEPSTTSVTPSPPTPGLSGGKIAAIVVCVTLLIVIIIGVIICIHKKMQNGANERNEQGHPLSSQGNGHLAPNAKTDAATVFEMNGNVARSQNPAVMNGGH